MRTELSLKHINRTESLAQDILSDAEKVAGRLRHLKEESSHLSVHIEKNPHKDQYYCWLNLYLPSKVIHVRETMSTLSKATTKAFHSMLIQVDKYKCKIERHLQKSSRKKRLPEEDDLTEE